MAPYHLRDKEEVMLYKKHYKPTDLSWLDVVREYGSKKMKDRYLPQGAKG